MPPIIAKQCCYLVNNKKLLDFDSFSPAFQLVSHIACSRSLSLPLYLLPPPHQPTSQTLGQEELTYSCKFVAHNNLQFRP